MKTSSAERPGDPDGSDEAAHCVLNSVRHSFERTARRSVVQRPNRGNPKVFGGRDDSEHGDESSDAAAEIYATAGR